MVNCVNCEQYLCQDCDKRIHNKGARMKHVREQKFKIEAAVMNEEEMKIQEEPVTKEETSLSLKGQSFTPSNRAIQNDQYFNMSVASTQATGL